MSNKKPDLGDRLLEYSAMIELLTEEKEKFESRQSRSYSPMGYTWTLGVHFPSLFQS